MIACLKKPVLAALLLVSLWTLCRLAVLRHTGIPQPRAQDENSYLLGADTFAHGRLANQSPALANFFESPHELVRPTYASKYPPGQAMFLALGQTLFGAPFYGVLIGNALMLFTFCLMLFAWVPPPWAMTVSAMFALILTPKMYWTNSYWGGSVAASGGALVLLAIGIYRKRRTALAGATFAFGALLLFWTRPYEGGVFTVAILLVFAREIWNKPCARALLAAGLVFAVGGAWTCWDNKAVTGNPFQLPYLLHDHQYNVAPVLWFLPLRPEPIYSHSRLASQHGTSGFEAGEFRSRNEKPWWWSIGVGIATFFSLLEWQLKGMILAVLLVPVAWRDPLFRKMAIVAGVVMFALGVETFRVEHYSAPIWAGYALLIAVWAQQAWNVRILGRRVGVVLVLSALAVPGLVAHFSHPVGLPQRISGAPNRNTESVSDADNWPNRRAELIKRLSSLDRPQLVIVRYPTPNWRISEEWVYNGADIDRERVIFAHDLGSEQNRILLSRYSDRTIQLLTFDSSSGRERIGPYPRMSPLQR